MHLQHRANIVDLWSVSCTFSSCSAAPPSSVSSPPPICSGFFAAVSTLRGFWVGFWDAGFLTGSSFPFPFLPFFPLSFSSLVEPADYRRKAIILFNVWVSRTEWIRPAVTSDSSSDGALYSTHSSVGFTHPEQLHHQLPVLFVLVFVLLLDLF